MLALFGVLSFFVWVASLLVLIVKMIRKNPTKKILIILAVAFAVFATCMTLDTDSNEDIDTNADVVETTDSANSDNSDNTKVEATKPSDATEDAEQTQGEPGDSKDNPIVVTVEEFINEINNDVDAAKLKYNEKWIEITGKVTDYSRYNSDSLSGFYLYGDYGDDKLRVVCWQNKGELKPFERVGDTCTCTGIVREVTTVNATEIGDCVIVFE